ncbi:hypothetical protein D0Z00_002973 [Geotrichum galactomycetum]|uniref:Uncharacterized protein n=1 Tax=Geotrichum galactomycetum TaxID=27317 RepID=A0ACB6V2Y5_9ASCO|nr:hypothetical protein D0Z00_002973 [Geotrichum candidum]
MPEAYFTLLYNDVYLPGALVLAQALRSYGTTRDLAVLVGSQVSDDAIARLNQVFDHVVPTETISNSAADAPQFKLLGRPELERSYTKVHVWRQTQFSRIVFLDADTLPLRSLDGLFSEDEYPLNSSTPIAASPDIGWPDIFNSGVFVTVPSAAIYDTLVGRAKAGLSFDGGDQGLLNQYFEGRWKRLPFTYNVTPSASYQYTPAYQHFKDSVNVVHFIGAEKPWSHAFTGPWPTSSEFELKWWAIYNQYYTCDLTLKSAPVAETPQPVFENLDSIPATIEEPTPAPVYYPPATIEEDIHRWDATRYQPPRDSKPEAADLVIEHYHNAWDTHQPSQPQYPSEHHAASDPKQETPEEYHPSTPAFQVNPEPVKPVFPWEFAANPIQTERVFPEEEYYQEEEQPSEPEVEVPETPVQQQEQPQLQEPFDFTQTQKALESLVHPEPISTSNATREFRDYSLPPDNHSFGGVGNKNVWDVDPSILSYISRAGYQFGRKARGNYEDDEDEEEEEEEYDEEIPSEHTQSEASDNEQSDKNEADIEESIADAESEIKANVIVHAKIHSENDVGVIMKKRVADKSKQKKLAAINNEFDSVYSPSLVTSALPSPSANGRLLLPVTPRTGLSDTESIETSPVGKETEASLDGSADDDSDDEPWDPQAKLAELAQLTSLIVAKQAEFDAKYEKKFGKRVSSNTSTP